MQCEVNNKFSKVNSLRRRENIRNMDNVVDSSVLLLTSSDESKTESKTDDESDELDGILSGLSGVQLIHCEHNYSKKPSVYDSRESSDVVSSTLPEIVDENISVPVRRSKRQLKKNEKEIEDKNINVTQHKDNYVKLMQSPSTSDTNAEIKKQSYADVSVDSVSSTVEDSNEDLNANNTPSKKLKTTHENNKTTDENCKTTDENGETTHENYKATLENCEEKCKNFLQEDETKHLLSPTIQGNKKGKLSGEKPKSLPEEKAVAQKRKAVEKNELISENKSLNVDSPLRRKRYNSEPPKNDKSVTSDIKEEIKQADKCKKTQNSGKVKHNFEKLLHSPQLKDNNCSSPSPKRRKRNISEPSSEDSSKNHEKKIEIKTVKKRISSSFEDSSNASGKHDDKSSKLNGKNPLSKSTPVPLTTPTKQSKQKKAVRKETTRVVVNDDEPPLFSQPDVLVKVKSDEKGNIQTSYPSNNQKNALQEVENVSSSMQSAKSNHDSEVIEPNTKNLSTSIKIDISPKNNDLSDIVELSHNQPTYSELNISDFDTKDIDSENSLQIDESIERTDDDKENSNEASIISTQNAPIFFDKSSVTQKDITVILTENDSAKKSKAKDDKSNIDVADVDKPIAERKPRRNIKKKEFFEDITERTSAQNRKSAGKPKATGKKSEDSSKKGKKSKVDDDDDDNDAAAADDDDDDSEEYDDPEKLWCICRKPHNDRFMIQCDNCEDWFHGSCVGVTRQLGRKLEKLKKEWMCPNCLKKGEAKSSKPQPFLEESSGKSETSGKKSDNNSVKEKKEKEKNNDSDTSSSKKNSAEKVNNKTLQNKSNFDKQNCSKKHYVSASSTPQKNATSKSNSQNNIKQNSVSTNYKKESKQPAKKKSCIICHNPNVSNSCYCNDKCIEKHVADCLAFLSESKGISKVIDESQRINVVDCNNGTFISGENAPTAKNIISWLKANQTFMIAFTTSMTSSKKELPFQKKDDAVSSTKDKKENSDESSKATVRLNVRKTLKNILMDRCKNADDIDLPEEDVRKIAVKIEEELHNFFKDNSFKYRAKYRSLMFNIKDPRNQGLFRKILKGNIPPDKLVRMSPEELASVELAKWREQENQHLLDMIKRVQLEQQTGSSLLIKKTHKGEVEIEDDFTNIIEDLPKYVSSTNAEVNTEEEKSDLNKEIAKDTTHHHRSHLFDLNCKICTGKILPPPINDTAPKKVRVAHSISLDQSSGFDTNIEKNISRIVDSKSPLSNFEDDSLDQEPTSTVSICSPESSSKFMSNSDFISKSGSSVWKGFIYMQDVAKFVSSAYKVSGPTEYLNDVPDTIQVCGRIVPDQVFDYLGKIKQSGNKELIIIRFQAANDEEAVTYNSFYSYLSSRKRYGVVSSYSKKIKDFYILPLAATSPVPIVLMPFDGPGLPSPRPHLLLGVIVCHKAKQVSYSSAKKKKRLKKKQKH